MKYREYLKTYSLPETLEALDTYRENAFIVAGATDVMVKARSRDWYKDCMIVDIGALQELSYIRENEDKIMIGAMTTIAELLESEIIKKHAAILWQACRVLAGPQIRNRATIGGNLANSCLAADTIPALSVLKADLKILSLKEERHLMAEKLVKKCPACLMHEEMTPSTCYYGIPAGKKSNIRQNELLTEISFRKMDGAWKIRFEKIGRRQMGCMSRFTLAAALLKNAGIVENLRISIGSAFADIHLLEEYTNPYIGTKLTAEQCSELAQALGDAVEVQQKRPCSSVLYKAEVCRRLTARTLWEMTEV